MTPAIEDLARWIQSKIDTERFGEVNVCLKLHEGRPVMLEKSFTEKIQLTGGTGAHGNNRTSR